MELILVYIILFIISVSHLRTLIANLFPIPENDSLWSRIFQPHLAKLPEEVKQEISNINSKLESITNIVKGNLHTISKDQSIRIKGNPHVLLFELISRYLYKSEKDIQFSRISHKIRSDYYINTMSAAIEEDDIYLMTDLLHDLVINTIDDFDFVVCPKSGNPIFSYTFAIKHRVVPLIIKRKDDNSYGHTNDGEEFLSARINFEGFDVLLKKAHLSKKPLKGIVIDCNCTSGSQLLFCMK